MCSYSKEFLFEIKGSFMEEFGADAIPMFECLVWGFDSIFRHERRVFTFENVDNHETEEIGIHLIFVTIGMDLERGPLHCSIESFHHSICLRGIWCGMTMRDTVCITHEIKCSLQYALRIILPIASVVVEGILFPIICEDTGDLEWEEFYRRPEK